ncbi:MAG: haloalkane dehalogenase, partial [Mycobacterium sp.]|nr:haloalkane dehalogenase [Mycobacterium sp.]
AGPQALGDDSGPRCGRRHGARAEPVSPHGVHRRRSQSGQRRGHEGLSRTLPHPESRRPILAWARQLPLGGEPAELVARIETFDAWLATSTSVPKLLLTFQGTPSQLNGEEMAKWRATHTPSLETDSCGEAGHHAPEDRPKEIAAAISDWADRHGLR